MRNRMFVATVIVACVLLAALAFGVAACGGEAATTTSAAATPTTAAPATTTTAAAGSPTSAAAPTTTAGDGATTTTAAGSVTIPTLQMTPEVQAYIQAMQVWSAALQSIPDAGDPLSITDVSKVTDDQIKAAEGIQTQAHAALDQLKAIKAPAALEAFQNSLVSIISTAVDATDKAVDALKTKSQEKLDAAIAQVNGIEDQLGTLMGSLMPLLMGGTATS
jgi:hypothetical protein